MQGNHPRTPQLSSPKFRELDFETLQSTVKDDNKQPYYLVQDVDQDGTPSDWIIRANQGHSLKVLSFLILHCSSV